MRLCRRSVVHYVPKNPSPQTSSFLINHNISVIHRFSVVHEFKCQTITSSYYIIFLLPPFLLVNPLKTNHFCWLNPMKTHRFCWLNPINWLEIRSPILGVPNQFPSDSPRSRAVSVLFSSICLQRGTLPVVSNILRVLTDLQNTTKNWA